MGLILFIHSSRSVCSSAEFGRGMVRTAEQFKNAVKRTTVNGCGKKTSSQARKSKAACKEVLGKIGLKFLDAQGRLSIFKSGPKHLDQICSCSKTI